QEDLPADRAREKRGFFRAVVQQQFVRIVFRPLGPKGIEFILVISYKNHVQLYRGVIAFTQSSR
ncbi:MULTISPECIES: hypothetical protein, partial [Pseudomonas syringae group genomosp. 2]|uniref:hypothetical protein n=1 Tax=Pseudomonas syringae group genomosp. 2 TaxID=251698 RepID=UPI001C806AA3